VRDHLRNLVTSYEALWGDYQEHSPGATSLSPEILTLVARAIRRRGAAPDPASTPRPEAELDIASVLKAVASMVPEPPEGERRPPAVHLLRAAWALAIVEAKQRGVDPSDEVIAKIIEGDNGLLDVARLPRGTTAAEILQQYARDQRGAAIATRWREPAPAEREKC
jgi:hypothetical protein